MRRLSAHAITAADTSSCGDSYCAGFIAGLDRGWSVNRAALAAQGVGALGVLTGFGDAERMMREGALRDIGE